MNGEFKRYLFYRCLLKVFVLCWVEKHKKRYYDGEAVAYICMTESIAKSTFYSWLKKYKVTYTDTGVAVSAAEFNNMKRKVARLEKIIEVLQRVDCNLDSPLKTKLYELEKLHGQYSVRILCDALHVARGTYYNHVFRNKKKNNTYQMRCAMLSEKILDVYNESNQIYGAKKIKAALDLKDIHTSDRMVLELMNEMNISSIRSDSKKTYNKLHSKKKKDMLEGKFTVSAPNKVWVSDITYFKYNNYSYYIVAVIDLFSRKVISYGISKKQSTQLINSAFKNAYKIRMPDKGLIFHSDRGSQYTSYSFRKLLASYCVEQSFSPSGRPCHNAVMESFFSSLKKEELYRTEYHSETEMKERIQKYITFYNSERLHSTLMYKTPDGYENSYNQQLQKE